MTDTGEDKLAPVHCPYPECKEQFHPPGSLYCENTGKRLSSPFSSNNPPAREESSTPFVVELIDTLKHYRYKNKKGWKNLYILDSLPARVIKNAVSKCRLPEKEREKIPGIIDLTVLGTGNNCLVFGQEAIYCHNSRLSHKPGNWKIAYKDIKNASIEPYGKFDILVKVPDQPGIYINVAVLWNSSKKKKQLIDILMAVGQLAHLQRKENKTNPNTNRTQNKVKKDKVKKKKKNRRRR